MKSLDDNRPARRKHGKRLLRHQTLHNGKQWSHNNASPPCHPLGFCYAARIAHTIAKTAGGGGPQGTPTDKGACAALVWPTKPLNASIVANSIAAARAPLKNPDAFVREPLRFTGFFQTVRCKFIFGHKVGFKFV
jgi:hypothetical protein